MKARHSFALALVGGFLLLACGSKPPELPAVEWRIEMHPAKAGPYESLSVFANVRDSAGLEDIDELWVSQDEERLAWRLTSANWVAKTEGSETWIGSPGLERQDFRALPRALYRASIIDAAGERAEREFRVEGSFPDRPPPSLGIQQGKVILRSTWPENLVLAFDAAGLLLLSRAAPEGAAKLDDLFGPEAAAKTRELGAYGYDPPAHAGYYSWKVPVK